MNDSSSDDWLSLSEASTLLGVHTSTLRRWADNGRVVCQRTPGGHRRFSRRKLRPLMEGDAFEAMAEVPAAPLAEQPWHQRFVDAGLVDALRELGQRLGGIVVQFLMRSDNDPRHLEDGRSLGATYAARSRQAGIGLVDAVQAFLYYRTSFGDVLTQMPVQEGMTSYRLYNRYDQCMSAVLLGLIAGYENPREGTR